MTSFQNSVLVSFAGWNKLGSIPRWAQGFNAQRSTISEISKADHLPGIIVLKAPTSKIHDLQRRQLNSFVKRVEQTNQLVKIVLSFASKKSTNFESMLEALSLFPKELSSNIEISANFGALEDSFKEALVKYYLLESERKRDPLASAKNVVKVVRPLLADSGRLSAKAIAAEFGISVAQLAKQFEQSRQSLSKTPDAPGIQKRLRPYERIFRLRTTLTQSDFLAWLALPNRELDKLSPMELINSGRAEIVADLVEDMLLGAPA
jgi:hypothetical protein